MKEKLENWRKAHIIQAYQYIKHKGEDGDKDHIHLRIEPNKKLDLMVLQEELREYVVGSDKPLGVRPFRPSKEEDWFLYAVHDADYLKFKYGSSERGEKLPYDFRNIVVPEDYDLEVAFVRAKASLKHSSVNLATRLKNGENALDLALQGESPYVVNSLLRLLQKTDYERILTELQQVTVQYEQLARAVDRYGLVIVADEFGNVKLEKP